MEKSVYLSDIEQEKVENFMADPILKEAIRKVLLAGVYVNGVLKQGEPADARKNWALSFGGMNPQISNAELGENLRAYTWAINMVEAAWAKLEDYKVEKPQAPSKPKKNPAL